MPGGANLPIYDALLDSDIRHILVRHEQSDAHMANAFGRDWGRAGVCMGTSGPGATNLVTGEVKGYEPYVEVDPAAVERAAEMLFKAEKPLMMGGGRIRISNAYEPFQAVSELLMAPVITTLQGKGSFPEGHPLCLGPIGMHGRAESNKLVSECDLLMAVGVRFSDRSTGTFSEFCKQAKIIHIDADPSEFNKNKQVDLYIQGDANQVLTKVHKALARRITSRSDSNPWLARIKQVREEMKSIPAYTDYDSELSGPKIVRKMREVLPPQTILTTGVGRHQMWCEIHWRVVKPRTWITSTGLGTMGFRSEERRVGK